MSRIDSIWQETLWDESTNKRCFGCKEILPADAFSIAKDNSTGLKSRCKKCHAKYVKDRRNAIPGFHKQRYAENWPKIILKRFGITDAQYEEMLNKQGRVCKICGRPNKRKKRLAIDHDHDSGKIRGLLCDECNRALGKFGDDPARLRKALEYLEDYGKT